MQPSSTSATALADSETLEEQALIVEAWERGLLAWKLRPYQYGIYETIWGLIEKLRPEGNNPAPGLPGHVNADDLRIACVVACRKIGKSFIESLVSMEFGIRYPGSIIRIAAPTAVEARDIFLTEFAKILADCPEHLKPRPKGVDGHWHFPNGSVIVLKGVDMKPDRLRGPSSDLNFVDEASFVTRLQYLVDSILYPMTINTRGPTILCSTLSPSPNSEFNEYYDKCEPLGQAAIVDIYSAGFSPEVIAAEKKAVNQTTWEIEYECKRKRSVDMTVVPEWTAEVKAALVAETPTHDAYGMRPELAYWTRYTSADFGTVDNTAILTGYYDFAEACLWISREKLLQGAAVTAQSVAGSIRELEEADDAERPMHMSCQRVRTGDNNIELLQSIHIDQRLPIGGVSKLSLETMVNTFRLYVSEGRIRIHPRCVNLLACLDKAAWQEQAGTKRDAPRVRTLARSTLTDRARQPLGHFDTLMAAVYMCLNADRAKSRNPLPQTFITAPVAKTFGAYTPEQYGRVATRTAERTVARPVPAGKLPGWAGALTPGRPRR